MKTKLLLMSLGAVLTACAGASAADGYKVTVPLSEDEDSATAFLINYDNGQKIDSVAVTDAKAVFSGKLDEPVVARVTVDGQRMGTFILEDGEYTYTPGKGADTPLNNKLDSLQSQLKAIVDEFSKLSEPMQLAKGDEFEQRYKNVITKSMQANLDNPLGYYLFIDGAYEYSLPELKAALEKYPQFKKYDRVKKLLVAGENKERTQPGNKFVDFTITNDTISQSLSDYVGKGKYVLVDFWASWCGPCIRETKVIKEILNEYGPKGLEVLGVAVWDEPDATRNAIKQHDLPWPQIINAQSIPTDLYGISAIPSIFLIGPDGTILSRDKQDAELKAAVAAALDKK